MHEISPTAGGDSLYAVMGAPLDGLKGQYEATGRRLVVLRTGTGELVTDLGARRGGTTPVFSPDGRLFALGARRGKYELWNVREGKLLRSAYTRQTHVGFSADGRYFVQADENGTSVFETATWHELMRAQARGTIPAFAFDPSNQMRALVAPGMEEAQIFDMADGRLVARLPLDRTNAGPVTLSPDGNRLIVGTGNGDLVTWHLDRVNDRLEQLQVGGMFEFAGGMVAASAHRRRRAGL